jgi:hypothetical protein
VIVPAREVSRDYANIDLKSKRARALRADSMTDAMSASVWANGSTVDLDPAIGSSVPTLS